MDQSLDRRGVDDLSDDTMYEYACQREITEWRTSSQVLAIESGPPDRSGRTDLPGVFGPF